MKTDIYFNVHVSNYFNVPFSNKGKTATIKAENIINCPIVGWDIDTKKMLDQFKDEKLSLTGKGDGMWDLVVLEKQHKPDTAKWNGSIVGQVKDKSA